MTMNENKETKTSITDRKTYPKRNRKCVYKKVTVKSVLTVNKSKTSNKTSVRLKLAKSKIFPKIFKDPKLCYTCTECEEKFKSKLNMAVHMKIHKLERNRLKATEDLKKELICQTSPLNTPLDQLDSNCQLEEISTRSINTVQYCENTIQNIFVYRHKKPFKHRKPNSLIDKQCDSNFENFFTNDSGVIVIPNIYNCGRTTPFRTRKPNGLPPLIDDMLLFDKLNKHPLEIHLEKAKYTIKNSRTHYFSNTQSTVDSNFFKKHNLTVNSEIPIIASVVNNRGNDSIDFTLTKCRKKPTISDKDIYKPFECNHCGLRYKRRDYLRDHMITAHNGVFPYNCETCNKGFLRPNVLISHMRSHTGEKPFICHICNKHFAHKSNLHNHLKLHSGLKPFVCNECGKSFCTRANLSSHMKKHNGVKAHKCTKCELAFVHADTLKKHMMIHTGEKPFKCLICDKSFRRRTHLTVHERHHTNSRPFRCETCDKSFFEKSVLQSHMLQHTGVKAHTCDMCNKSFCHRSTLNVHQKIHGGERLFHCSVCEKSFCDKTTLVRHIRIHTGEKPFQCTVCNLRFRQSSNLKRHQRIHTGERPYKCTYCEKFFAQNINLTNHIRIHTGEKPFICGTCNKAFTQRSNLISHQKSHAGEDQIVEIYAEYPKGGARQPNAQPIRFKIRGTNMSISLDDLVTTSDTDVQRKLQLISERIAKKTLQNQGKFYVQSPTCQQDESTIVEETTNEHSEVNLPAEENQEESQEENESIIEQQDKYVEAIQFDNRTFIIQLAQPPSSQEERAQLQEALKQHLEQFQQSTTGEGEEKSFVVCDVSKGDLAAARNIYLEPNQTLALAALNHENLIVESNHANEIVISAQDNISVVNQEDQVIIPLADQEHLSELSQENVNKKGLFNVETIKVDKESDIYVETSSSQVDFSAVVVENRITHQPNEVFALSTNHLPQDEQHNVIAIEINNPQQQQMQNEQVVGININQPEMQLAAAEFSNAQENTFVVSSYDRAAYEQLLSTVVLQQQPASLDKSDTNFYTGITEETVIEENSQNESNSYYAGISEETVVEPQQQQNDNIQNILHYAVVSQTIESE